MLKGYRKQMIVLRGTGSEIFDEAYFILNKNGENYAGRQCAEGSAMLLEANRILEENRIDGVCRPKSYYNLRYALFFIGGLIIGMGAVILTLAIS